MLIIIIRLINEGMEINVELIVQWSVSAQVSVISLIFKVGAGTIKDTIGSTVG
jgi:hypothetical protein